MKRILIVEDQPELAKLLEIILKKENREIYLAETGEQAITLALQNKPDLILLDIMMPGGMDGYEVAQTLRGEPDMSECLIIAMTAKKQEKDRTRAFQSGMDGFIGKPFDLHEVRAEVEKLLH